ncbi:MAG: nucleoside kinase [Bacillota bacterium]
MGILTIQVQGQKMQVKEGTTFYELSKQFDQDFPHAILIAKQGVNFKELYKRIKSAEDITFHDVSSGEGRRVYNRGMLFLLARAVLVVFGKEVRLLVHHSLRGNIYCELKHHGSEDCVVLTAETLAKIKAEMKKLVEGNLPIIKKSYHKDEALRILKEQKMYDRMALLQYRRSSHVSLYELHGLYDYFYGHMPKSTRGLDVFDLSLHDSGFLLHTPSKKAPKELTEVHATDKLHNAYMEQLHWFKLMGVSNVEELNNSLVRGEFGNLIRVNEALHEKKVANIADNIYRKKDDMKIVLIAGPSSSGKTSFANRLCIQLQALGIVAKKLSMDDYFLPFADVPLDEEGNKDLESVATLDIPLLNDHLKRLIDGERVELPSYNFVLGKPEYHGHFMQLQEGEIIVMEGIHGLNDTLTAEIPSENKYKIFISAITQLNLDNHNRISTSDCRLLRRLVRDHRTRGKDAGVTLQFWKKVVEGEEKNIFPYQENADEIFNSSTIYELCVLKQYAEPLLLAVTAEGEVYDGAQRMIQFLGYFLSAPSTDIPNNSLIKEFIGGSCFDV